MVNCVGHGDTELDALQDVRQAMIDYIESLLQDDLPVPPPIEGMPLSVSVGIEPVRLSRRMAEDEQTGLPETIRSHNVAQVGA
jgi:hypothetical protein